MSESVDQVKIKLNQAGFKSVVFADDDAISRLIMKHVLGELFDHVYVRRDGQQATEVLDEHEIDLVISDVSMPVCDGFELERNVRSRNLKVKFIFLTGFGDERHLRAFKALDVTTLLKPVDSEDLIRHLLDVCLPIGAKDGSDGDTANIESLKSHTQPMSL